MNSGWKLQSWGWKICKFEFCHVYEHARTLTFERRQLIQKPKGKVPSFHLTQLWVFINNSKWRKKKREMEKEGETGTGGLNWEKVTRSPVCVRIKILKKKPWRLKKNYCGIYLHKALLLRSNFINRLLLQLSPSYHTSLIWHSMIREGVTIWEWLMSSSLWLNPPWTLICN